MPAHLCRVRRLSEIFEHHGIQRRPWCNPGSKSAPISRIELENSICSPPAIAPQLTIQTFLQTHQSGVARIARCGTRQQAVTHVALESVSFCRCAAAFHLATTTRLLCFDTDTNCAGSCADQATWRVSRFHAVSCRIPSPTDVATCSALNAVKRVGRRNRPAFGEIERHEFVDTQSFGRSISP